MAESEDPVGLGGASVAPAELLFEQYKLAVEMADRISARRGAANAFFATGNAALLAAIESLELALAPLLGLVFAGAWWLLLRSYRELNTAKFKVINELEKELPARPFTDEWNLIKQEDPVKRKLGALGRYAEFSVVEQVVPFVFAAFYVVSFIQEVG
jgi:hypothetical protein